jgi:hypothetical protein
MTKSLENGMITSDDHLTKVVPIYTPAVWK